MVTYHVPDVERDIALALQFIVEKRVDVKPILTHAFPLTRVQEAYDLFADRREGCVKVILEMDR
jgi:threonine dehydrogenase-like Zn-dependent dehydrogenase